MEEKKRVEKIITRVTLSLEKAKSAKQGADEAEIDDELRDFLYKIIGKALSYSLDVCFGSDEDFASVYEYNEWIDMELGDLQ